MRQGGVRECDTWRANSGTTIAAMQQSAVVEHGDWPIAIRHGCHHRLQAMRALRGSRLFGAGDGGGTTRRPLPVLHGRRVQLSHSCLLTVLCLRVV